MKKIAALLLVVIVFASCGGGEQTAENEIPQGIEAQKKMLKEKKAELKEIKTIIAQLEDSIRAADPNAAKAKRALVTTTGIKKSTFTRFVEIQGSVQAENTVKASSEIGGRLQGFTLNEGDYVKKGQLIGKVDLENVRKSIDELKTRLTLAEDVYKRQKSLWDQKIGTEVQYLQAKNNVEGLQKSIASLEFQLTKEPIYSPASGTINMVFARSGEVVGPGTPIFDILDLNQIKVVVDVPEIYIKSIRKGESMKIKFPALEEERSGRVKRLGNQINRANRTFQAEIALPNPGQKLIPNMLTAVLIRDYVAPNAITLPDEIIQQEVSGRSYVFIKGQGEGEQGDIAQKVYVEIGESYDGKTEIKSGLKGDETVIVEGARGLVEGELIKVN